MNFKLKRVLTVMGIGVLMYFIFGTIIQQIGDAFHVTWCIIPDYKGAGNHSIYWMVMIAVFFTAPIAYAYELFTKKRYLWQSKRSYILMKILTVLLMVLCVVVWYKSIIKYQTKFLM